MPEIAETPELAVVPEAREPDLQELLAERHRNCLPGLATLHALAGAATHPGEDGLPTTMELMTELDGAMRDVRSELGDAALALMDSLAGTPRSTSTAGFLAARLRRLDMVAKDVLGAAEAADGPALQRGLHQFHALAGAMWQVQLGIQGSGPHRP